jgi:hypothetical protein
MNLLKSGVLADNTPVTVNVGGNTAPMTATLNSSAPGRLIELSSDGGGTFYTPARDAEIGSMINVAILAPVSHVRFTGVTLDKWQVR